MKYIQIIITSAILLLTIGCKNNNAVSKEVIDPENTKCDLYLDLGYDSNGVYMITDSNFYQYLDTVCSMLSKVNSSHDADYYRTLLASERGKENPKRCLLVEKYIPYKVLLNIDNLPGWKRCVIKYVDERNVITGGKVTTKKAVPWLP